MFVLNKFLNKIKKSNYLSRSKKISKLLKELIGNNKIGIVDIGAGQRYLPTLLNFDGISKIAMIDPNKNLNWAYKNFIRLLNYPNNVEKFQFGISNKTKKMKYYKAKRSTGSTFIDIYKKAKKQNEKLDKDYYGEKNETKVQSYSFNDFVKKFFFKNPDIVKIDVEGFEASIIKSIFKSYNPFLIEIELNVNNRIYSNTFNEINNILVKKKYELLTAIPVYRDINNLNKKNKPFIYGDYHNPIIRSPLDQLDCIFVKKNKNKNLKTIAILIGYGFIIEAKLLLDKIYKNLPKKKYFLIKNFLKIN